MKHLSQWRTVIAVLLLGLLLLVALLICAQMPERMAIELYGSAAWTIGVLAALVAGKSAVQHLGNGSGVRGAIAALITEAKPAATPEPAAKS